MNTDFDLNMLRSDYYPYKSTNASGRMLTEEEEKKQNENYINIDVEPEDNWDKGSSLTTYKSWKATRFVKN